MYSVLVKGVTDVLKRACLWSVCNDAVTKLKSLRTVPCVKSRLVTRKIETPCSRGSISVTKYRNDDIILIKTGIFRNFAEINGNYASYFWQPDLFLCNYVHWGITQCRFCDKMGYIWRWHQYYQSTPINIYVKVCQRTHTSKTTMFDTTRTIFLHRKH